MLFLVLIFSVSAFAWKQSKSLKTIQPSLTALQAELDRLKSEDQYQRNERLQAEISKIELSYKEAVSIYEQIDDLKVTGNDVEKLEEQLISGLKLLSELNYDGAVEVLTGVKGDIDTTKAEIAQKELELAKAEQEKREAEARAKAEREEQEKLAAAKKTTPVAEAEIVEKEEDLNKEDNSLPVDGEYKRIVVVIGDEEFVVSIVGVSVSSTRVVVETASDTVCNNDCPILAVHDYTARSGAFAGINGNFFCPSSYPSCADNKNSSYLVVMNRQKKYLNQANPEEAFPAVIFGENHTQFISDVADWDTQVTNINGLMSNYPMLVKNGNKVFTGHKLATFNSKTRRSFIANKDNMVFMGVVHHATTYDSTEVLYSVGMSNALNLDGGGSSALWYEGKYKVGPGRNVPNSILFIKK